MHLDVHFNKYCRNIYKVTTNDSLNQADNNVTSEQEFGNVIFINFTTLGTTCGYYDTVLTYL